MVLTLCAAHAMGKENDCFFLFFCFQLLFWFVFVAVREIELYSIQKESFDDPVYYPGTFV